MLVPLLMQLAAAQSGLLIDRPAQSRPQVMLLGSPHLANNNRDVANIPVADVTTPARQREIEAIVARLATFHPTRIAVEWPIAEQAKLDRRYADYRAGRLAQSANERDQIALRLAAKLGLARVDAIDWNEEPPGVEADYDWTAFPPGSEMAARVAALQTRGQADASAVGRDMLCTSVASWYRAINSPAEQLKSRRAYYDFARLGGPDRNPGATWVGNWYARNLRIFTNLDQLAKPSDRVLVLYGAGHTALLDSYVRESQAFALVDPARFLPPAGKTTDPSCPRR